MGAWDTYEARIEEFGCPKREMIVRHTQFSIRRRMLDSPSLKHISMDGKEQLAVILSQTNMDQKRICALPGDRLRHGGLVDFANSKWLIMYIDADREIYERGTMQRCNHVLKWISKDGELKQKWCFIEDGTKYLTGEYNQEIITVGDARYALYIGKDEDTNELHRGMRFLIDDPDSDACLAYEITKPDKLHNMFDGDGIFKFILAESPIIDADNKELRIADYDNWMPKRELDGDHRDSERTLDEIVDDAYEKAEDYPPSDDKKVWL